MMTMVVVVVVVLFPMLINSLGIDVNSFYWKSFGVEGRSSNGWNIEVYPHRLEESL